MRKLVKLLGVAAACGTFALVAGCGGDKGPTQPKLQNNRLKLGFFNTPAISSPWVYQLWAYKDGWQAGPMFRLTTDAHLLDLQGQAYPGDTVTFASLDLKTCDSLRVTLRTQSSGTDEGLVVLAGPIPVGASLSVRLESVLIGEVGAGDLRFVYATPTDTGTSHDNELSGVWFAGGDLASPGLGSLPALPTGWIFEGWVKHGGVLLSTGKFLENSARDLGKQYYTGTGPDFPGEDFLTNAPTGIIFPFQFDQGDTVMISLEPEEDFEAEQPFLRWYVHEEVMTSLALQPRQAYVLEAMPTNAWPAANGFIASY